MIERLINLYKGNAARLEELKAVYADNYNRIPGDLSSQISEIIKTASDNLSEAEKLILEQGGDLGLLGWVLALGITAGVAYLGKRTIDAYEKKLAVDAQRIDAALEVARSYGADAAARFAEGTSPEAAPLISTGAGIGLGTAALLIGGLIYALNKKGGL